MKFSAVASLPDLVEYGNIPTTNENECWLWQRLLWSNGYGRFGNRRAHRVAWEFVNGKIINRLLVLHKCDVRKCINPSHLFLGTQLDNMQDMIEKGRKVVASGDDHPMKRDDIRAAFSGENHWTKRMPDRIARGSRHWSKLHPEQFANVAFNGSMKRKGSE